MIAWWVVVAGFVAGVGGAAVAGEAGWFLQRAEDRRGGRPGELPAAPPYNWADEADL